MRVAVKLRKERVILPPPVRLPTDELWCIRVKSPGKPDAFLTQPDGSYFVSPVDAIKAWKFQGLYFGGCKGELHRVKG